MSRLRADLLLLLAALIWGLAFIAQKEAFEHVGAYTFVAARFLLSLALVLPFALREWKKVPPLQKSSFSKKEAGLLCATFSAAVILQQAGVGLTTVTNAGFLTGLYVVFVPLICAFVYKQKLSRWIFPAALLSLAGAYLLSGGRLGGFSTGDLLIFLCAVFFALQVVLIGRIMSHIAAPFSLSCIQYAAVGAAGLIGALVFEQPSLEGLAGALLPILYAGVLSGGIAYTLQVVAQQYSPASDAAIILSGEAVFAAAAGAILLGERLSPLQYGGCGLIVLAILLVEVAPLLARIRK